MQFFRRPRIERITLEGRKAAAFRRRQTRELERYPLLADEIAETQIDIKDAETKRNALAMASEQRSRDFEARVWKMARCNFFTSSDTTRAAIRAMWSSWTGPKTCTYFSYVVDICTGRFERRSQAAKERDRAIRRKVLASIGYQPALNLECPENRATEIGA